VTGLSVTRNVHRKFSIVYPLSSLQNKIYNKDVTTFAVLQQRKLRIYSSSALSVVAIEQPTSTPTLSPTMDHTLRLLAKAWTPRLIEIEHKDNNNHIKIKKSQRDACEAAVRRTLPLFLQVKGNETYYDDASAASVPFVCRYRTDIINPLTTQQVHLLRSMVGQYDSLRSLRNKLLPYFPPEGDYTKANVTSIRDKILTSVSKSELEDLYAPFKPPPKGSIFERLQNKHPELVDSIEAVWKDKSSSKTTVVKKWLKIAPREAVVQVLGTKIASEPQLTWWMIESLRMHCRVKTTVVAKKKTDEKSKNAKAKSVENARAKKSADTSKYSEAYGDFSARIMYMKDYQVLAIRRGVQEKALKMVFDIDSEKMESHLLWMIRKNNNSNIGADKKSLPSNENEETKDDKSTQALAMVIPAILLSYNTGSLLKEAIHDAWSRLLRRRGTTRLWAEKCKEAQDRACQVFEDNLHRALLAPPYHNPSRPLLAMDPGFAAGIKCALLDSEGSVLRLDTIRFLGSDKTKTSAIAKLEEILQELQSLMETSDKSAPEVTIALGNGHGSGDSRQLIQEASANCGIPIDIQLVSEAGASVWSVTQNAKAEFPNQPPAAVAAISIGRRLQNPLFELVKVPPKSLGLGMYQHDLSEKELDEKLHLTSVDAVAVVGVDVNSGSLEILQKVPGLTASLSEKIIKARPLKQRDELLKISGLGPKSYENCAGFVRIANGPEPLDNTLVHPESYALAQWLLKKFSWELCNAGNGTTIQQNRDEWRADWEDLVARAARKHSITHDRVLAVLQNLVDSASNEDPRLKLLQSDHNILLGSSSSSPGMVESCKPLAPEMSEISRLSEVIAEHDGPIRGIVGAILNVADFGAFVDIGNENNGLLHVSKLGPNLQLQSLLIGQQIGVDILSVSPANKRISLGLHGCNLQATVPRSGDPRTNSSMTRGSFSSTTAGRNVGNKRSVSTKAGKRNSSASKKRRRVAR